MGNAQLRFLQRRLGWSGLPDTERATYFAERLMMGWFELLCCPTAMGCTVLLFEPRNPDGGEPKYEVKLRLSHSEYVPRYQLHVVRDRKIEPWIVGHMEKTETHLRAKPGEFVRAQIWNLTCNSMVMERRRSARQRKNRPCLRAFKERPTPSAQDMQTRGMSIALQAKMDLEVSADDDETRLNRQSERWVQMVGVDSRLYKIIIEPPKGTDPFHPNMKSMSVMRILYKGQKVCVARKQRFAGALGRVEQPFLGVQIKPPEDVQQKVATGDDEQDNLKLLLDTSSLMLLLMCLAWSEETMSPQIDMTPRFVQAMRASPGEAGSAQDCGLSVQWDTEDMKSRLKQYSYARLHNWNKDKAREVEQADGIGRDSALAVRPPEVVGAAEEP